jgi:hypothetical protein
MIFFKILKVLKIEAEDQRAYSRSSLALSQRPDFMRAQYAERTTDVNFALAGRSTNQLPDLRNGALIWW